MKYRMLAEAKDELRAAAEYYDLKRTGLGDEFLDAFERQMIDVVCSPARFARVRTRGTGLPLRRASFERFPYSVIFYVDKRALPLSQSRIINVVQTIGANA